MLSVYKRYYRFLFKYKLRFTIFLVLLLAWGIFEGIQPYFYKLFVEQVPSGNFNSLLVVLLMYVGLRVLTLFLDIVTCFIGDSVSIPSARDARMAVFKKIQDLDFAFSLTRSTGSMISSIKRGDLAFFNFFLTVNIRLVRIALSFVVTMVVFTQLKIEIALVMFVSMVINLFFAYFLIKTNIKARRKFNKAEDNISGVIVDNMINFETVKLFAKEREEYKKLGRKFVPWSKKLWGYANSFRKIDTVVGTLGELSLFLVLFIGLKQVANFSLSTAEYIMVLGFVSAFYPKFFELIYELRNIAKFNVDLQKYFSVFELETLVKDPEKPIKKEFARGEIVFDKVSFSYPEGQEHALKNVSLRIREGQSIAFVGHSGAGKTTITKLIMRFYDPTKGKISIDGVDIKKLTKTNLRSFMGVVPQEPVLFNESLAYNIGYGSGTDNMEEITASAKMANLHNFIIGLKDGYQTMVGERGVRLSGGQKQRLAIARMILANPDIIIFDEATSQLDSESEKLIQDAFWKASKDKTTIIIVHRLSSITKVDKIVVMEKGKIVEIGTHKELVRKQGVYNKFWQLQTVV